MRLCLSLTLALMPLSISAAVVHFYYDTNCQEYAASVTTPLNEVVGGPYGSQSMLFVEWGPCCERKLCPSYLYQALTRWQLEVAYSARIQRAIMLHQRTQSQLYTSVRVLGMGSGPVRYAGPTVTRGASIEGEDIVCRLPWLIFEPGVLDARGAITISRTDYIVKLIKFSIIIMISRIVMATRMICLNSAIGLFQ